MNDLVAIESYGPRVKKLTAAAGISHHGTCASRSDLWLSANAYQDAYRYQTVYITLGAHEAIRVEDLGVLPQLFIGPDDAVWSVVTTRDSPSREVIRPVGGPPGKAYPPFVGEPLWRDGAAMLFHNSDPFSSTKPDRWMRYDLINGSRKLIKLPLPNHARFVAHDDGVHSLARSLHRLHDADGSVTRERTIALTNVKLEPIALSFSADSQLFGTDGKKLWWVTVSADGRVDQKLLLEGSFFTLWPVIHTRGGVVLRYVGENGNGWLIARDGELVGGGRSTSRGYVDPAGAPIVELPEAEWILSGIAAVGDELSIVVYAKEDSVPKALWVARV